MNFVCSQLPHVTRATDLAKGKHGKWVTIAGVADGALRRAEEVKHDIEHDNGPDDGHQKSCRMKIRTINCPDVNML